MWNRGTGRLVLAGLLSGVAGGTLSGWLLSITPVVADEPPTQAPKIVTAEEFRLVDSNGHVRALIAFSADGQPYLSLLDQKDTHRVWLGIALSETGAAVRDIDGKTGIVLSLDNAGEPSLVIRDRQGRSKMFHP